MNFIIAGRDTTAQTLTWFMYELTRTDNKGAKVNLMVEKKIRQEIETVLNKHNETGYVSSLKTNVYIMYTKELIRNNKKYKYI